MYDPFTNLLTLFSERDQKDAPCIKALRNPLVREMPPSLKSTVMADFVYTRDAVESF